MTLSGMFQELTLLKICPLESPLVGFFIPLTYGYEGCRSIPLIVPSTRKLVANACKDSVNYEYSFKCIVLF